ncbi:BatA and WFA domain-containing protein [Roseimicrobium sp. ORNL1]|uniref:vWA domain-containing protein n=1 Tax=Roseimicrobium sp. ORNL1 TaxID=2711231 RepID=UPI0013E1997A|nr:BatA and WFA domain-containing protein [Roseimicrobium sp. ORNL1]QIF03047.1 VWA domain-containing protein [Roseimicrobium sp. ORNL1]
MSLLAPAFLWTLVALAPLAAIYFLKVRPRKKPVTAYFLWQKIFTEKKASALFKRLRDVLSLILMALAFAAVAFALAEPDFAGDERKDLLIVVDHSASMSAKEGTSTRLEQAKAKAKALITGLNGTQRAAVATFANGTEMRAHPTRHRKSLLDAVDAIGPTELPSRVEALRSLQPGNEWMKNMRVLLITDGCLDDVARLPQVEILKVGSAVTNAGLARADLRAVPGGVERLGLFLLPVSSSKEPVKTDITLTHVDSNRIVKVLPVTLNAGDNPPVTLTLDDAPSGRWTASIGLDDALAADNTVHLYVPPREPVPVGVLAEDAFFLQHVVAAFDRSDQMLTLAEDAKSARIFLARSKAPESASAIVFQPQGDSPFWSQVGEEILNPVPKVVAKDHPLLRYLDAETINFAGAHKLTSPVGAVVLVADEGGTPLIYLMRQGEQTVCVVNLDPLVAQFYLSAWFPVLVHNGTAHLTHREGAPPATVPTGGSLRVPGLAEGTTAKMKSPSGTERNFTGSDTGELLETGFYEISHAGGAWTAGCSLVSPEESQLQNDTLKDTAKPIASGQSPSYWLLVLGVLVVAGESVLYHRRKVG